MSQKDLEKEFKNLSTEFKQLQSITEKLYEKYEYLENKYEKCLKKKAAASFKCRVCGQECENVKDLREHKKKSIQLKRFSSVVSVKEFLGVKVN